MATMGVKGSRRNDGNVESTLKKLPNRDYNVATISHISQACFHSNFDTRPTCMLFHIFTAICTVCNDAVSNT